MALRIAVRLSAVLVSTVAFGAPIALAPRSVYAQTSQTQAEDAQEAKRLFTQGSSAFLAKRYGEALDDLRASYKLVPSPNSGLLIARCLRELNRRVEAVEMFTAVAADARRRASEGDAKYAQTADVATAEAAALRATLGTVRVRVTRPPPGSIVVIDGAATPATEGEIVALHAPGEVSVKFKPRTGAEQSQRASLAAGSEVRMEFTAPADAAPLPTSQAPPIASNDTAPPPTRGGGEPPAWALPAALVSAGVAVAGGAVFAGFGLKSEQTYTDLQNKCGAKGCGTEDRDAADAGKRDQTIANVGLVVGITGAAAAITFLLVRAYAPRTATVPASPRFIFTAGGVSGLF